MSTQLFLLIAATGLCALISNDITKAVRTGNARGRTGVIKRATRPEAFRDYIISDVIGLALCFGVAIWAIVGIG
jgi:hypothetical protein